MATLWFGGSIYTMRDENEKVEAVLTNDKRIIDLGNTEELLAQYGSMIDKKINLQGKTMLPGLVDSHMHLIGHGEKLMRLNLSGMKSRNDVLMSLENQSSQFSEGDWIIAEGWNENEWSEPELILADELDKISTNNPILIKRVCRHAMVVNTKAMELLNMSRAITEPAGGVIGRYEDGRLNGLFKDNAQDLIFKAMPEVTDEYLKKAMTMAIKDCHRLGLVGVHTEDLNYYSGFQNTFNTFVNVIEEDGHTLKAHLLVHHGVVDDMFSNGYHFKWATEHIEFGPMKIFADGSLGGRTALLGRPYQDDPSTNGVAIHTPEELKSLVLKAREYEMPVAVHAIGDLAFEYVLDAIEEYPPVDGQRDRPIHAQILRKELIDRVKKLPVVLDIQPAFVTSDFPWVIDRIGPDYMKYNYAWKTLLNEGLACAGGSDAPIEELNPLLGIYAAVTRKKLNGDGTIYGERERLTMYEAISLYTKGSAFAAGNEHETGMIQRDYYADFTVLDIDPFAVNPEALLLAKAMLTVINGKVVYEA